MTLTTRMIQTYDKFGHELALEPAECRTARAGTLGYQLCTRPEGHEGNHRSQDGREYSDGSPND